MKFSKIYFLTIILMMFSGCKTTSFKSGKYEEKNFNVHRPGILLNLQNNNYFIMKIYPNYEKEMGKWYVKNDTLILNSEFKSSLENEKDSIFHIKKRKLIIKGKKLFYPNNKEFYLKRLK